MASDDLYVLNIKNGIDKANWVIVPIVGTRPGKRYGHTMNYYKPNIVVFGGHTGIETLNDVVILNIEKSPFSWIKININGIHPSERVYHSASLCSYGSASGMVVIF